MEIYSRINEHKMMNKEDIVNIINYRLKSLNLYKKGKNVFFVNDNNIYFQYMPTTNKIIVNNNYKKLTFPIFKNRLIKAVKKTGENTFIPDFYNLELLVTPYHEVRHAEQYNKLMNNKKEYYNILIDKSWSYIDCSEKFYLLNHPRFLVEHDATLNAEMQVLKDIENNKLNVCKNSLYLFNANIAVLLLRSRGYAIVDNKLTKKGIFRSPLLLIYFYNKSLYFKKNIDKKEFDTVNNAIKKIRINNITEYDRIISGDNLSDETINELFLIATGKILVKNIFKYFENKELNKNNNHYVKKLLLSKE